MTYREVLEYLYTRLPMFQRVGAAAFKKDLTNTIRLCEALGNPHKCFPAIHIAGTNGKGSSSHMLAAALQSAGYKTGLYTSPHLKSFTERIRINGVPVGEAEIVNFVEKMRPVIEEINPSFFEVTVAMAFDYFRNQKVDIAVIEVGLGGRLDSTNVINPLVSLITNISFDHQEMLGDTIEEIAFEKAGIIKPKVPVVIGLRQHATTPVFEKIAAEKQSVLLFAGDDYVFKQMKQGKEYTGFEYLDKGKKHNLVVETGLMGNYQQINIPGVLKTLELVAKSGFAMNQEAILLGIRNVIPLTGLKGRWQTLSEEPRVICDVAHNEDGIKWITGQLQQTGYHRLHFIIGMVKDKKRDAIFELLPKDAIYYFCQANIPRALEAGVLAGEAKLYGLNGVVIPGVNEALNEAKRKYTAGDLIFIGGSTFVVAEIENL